MRVLLDTHAFLWWITDDPRLSANARQIISNGTNELFLSAASAWEIAIKAGLGRLRFKENNLERFIAGQLTLNTINSLSININHALRVNILDPHHRDPFDRLLVAQAQLETLPILTSDPLFKLYSVTVLW